MKIGDQGVGRSHSYIVKGNQKTQPTNQNKGNYFPSIICQVICIIIMVILWVRYEINMKQKQLGIQLITSKITNGHHQGQQGVDYIEQNSNKFQNKIIYLKGVSINNLNIKDQEFGFTFKNVLNVKRDVEYCQWEQIMVQTTQKINSNPYTGEQQELVTVTPHYEKDWRKFQIDSSTFKEPISFHNPQRNPVDRYNKYTSGLLGGKIKIDTQLLLNEVSIQQSKYVIKKNLQISEYAYQNGFYGNDAQWVYSKYMEDYSILKPILGFALEGVIDMGIKGKCTAGDIRVGWNQTIAPTEYTIIGLLNKVEIKPYKLSSGQSILLAAPGSFTVQEMEKKYRDKFQQESAFFRWIFMGIIFALICSILKTVLNYIQQLAFMGLRSSINKHIELSDADIENASSYKL